jgi:hypothetical protein
VCVKDLGTGNVVLASTSDAGSAKANGRSESPSLSADGTRLAFHSYATNLDPADPDGWNDVFVKDLGTGGITLASTSDVGRKSPTHSRWPSLSADGTSVAFVSGATNFDPGDTRVEYGDVYVKDLSTTVTEFGNCSNGERGAVRIGPGTGLSAFGTYPSRPLDCPSFLPGAAPSDYPDLTPILIGGPSSFAISWGSGGFSVGLAKAKSSPPGEPTLRLVLVITQGGGRYAPTDPSQKTKIQSTVAFSPADSYDCSSDSDAITSLDLSLSDGDNLIVQRS